MPPQATKQKTPVTFSQKLWRVPLSEKILFAKHMSMMISSGMTVVDAVRLIKKQLEGGTFAKILDKVIVDLESGQYLSVALGQFPDAFGRLFISLIQTGEISGTLPANLDHLSAELKKSSQLESAIRSALMYPAVIFAATMGIIGLLVFYVLPKILPVFASLHVKLPLETRIMIAVTDLLLHHYLWIIAGLIVFVIILLLLLRIPLIRYAYHRTLLALPVVGRIATDYNMANITRTLGVFLKSGTKITEALEITAESLDNDVYKKALHLTTEEVRKGNQLHKYFEEHANIFPPTVSRMIEVGENTGKLDGNLFYLADFYAEEVDETTKNLSSIIEPVMLVFMGTVVGFVAISIIKPIYAVTQTLTM